MFLFYSILAVLFSLMSVVVDGDNQYVPEYNQTYYCCNPHPIIPKEHCELTCSFNGMTFARIDGSHKACVTPCQKDGDKLEIHRCVDFTAHNVCKNGGVTSEERIHYKAQLCQHLQSSQTRPQPQGHVGLLLVAFLIFGFFTNC